MSEETNAGQESQKTVVAFIVGLIIGGLLVWVFTDTPAEAPVVVDEDEASETADVNTSTDDDVADSGASTSTTAPVAELPTGDGEVSVGGQTAGSVVALESATFPIDEGWIGVRDYANGQLSGLLGVVRFSKEQGLVPEQIVLQRPTETGKQYAIVFYSESGDREFSLADDIQIEGEFATFTAN